MTRDSKGFLRYPRVEPPRRPAAARVTDWAEVVQVAEPSLASEQATRCMDCGIPFCHHGCPLGNLIPEWNDLASRQRWAAASERLQATNNFPEFTGRLCPAPCEASCVLGINRDPVTIEQIEKTIAEVAFAHGWVRPLPPTAETGHSVAIVGSGPAGLAAAQQLRRAGHRVTVYERSDRVGGLLRYGIPEFKLAKEVLERRLAQLVAEGVRFVCEVEVGRDVALGVLREEHDAVVLALGSTRPRLPEIPGAHAQGVVPAMDFLPAANRAALDRSATLPISAQGRRVVILGGGDTGSDCLGTALRQGARSVLQLEIMPEPPRERDARFPWPTYPLLWRISSSHEEAGREVRSFARETVEFVADEQGWVSGLRVVEVAWGQEGPTRVAGSEEEIPADLVLIAMGFVGPELDRIDPDGELARTPRGTLRVDERYATSVPGVFAAGDCQRGQSLIVWAISEGRSVAHFVDAQLEGATELPCPIAPSARPLTV
jgi:glutamate synthase (NADPH/NADH) small chain